MLIPSGSLVKIEVLKSDDDYKARGKKVNPNFAFFINSFHDAKFTFEPDGSGSGLIVRTNSERKPMYTVSILETEENANRFSAWFRDRNSKSIFELTAALSNGDIRDVMVVISIRRLYDESIMWNMGLRTES